MNENTKVLIGSPIRQTYNILVNFISSLSNIMEEGINIEYFFIDDNDDINSSTLLKNFAVESKNKVIIEAGEKIDTYVRTEDTHYWKESLIWKIAQYKNRIIEYAKENCYDYLFLIDSDIMLHPKTLSSLINSNKDIICEVFWTRWQKNADELPQVWMCDEYSFITKERNEILTEEESNKRYTDFIEKLKKPGIYEVGGLGACTLISKKALNKGVNFNKIYNLSFWGEDRHFCIRAAALGFKLYVDTTYPAYHIYRREDLKGVEQFRNKCIYDINNSLYYERIRIDKDTGNKLTLVMLVRNESKKFLERVLTHAVKYIDNAVILDDASEDNSVEICKKVLENVPLTLVENKEHGFNNEVVLRKQLWKIATSINPDWMLFLDADEIFEDRICEVIRALINQPNFDYYAFRLYDMWDENHYREDFYWGAHKYYRPFLIRYQPNFNYIWDEKPLHCGRIPKNIFSLPGCICYVRLKHFGWSTNELRQSKYIRYLRADPEGKYGSLEQYKSIIDENPRLIEWQ